MQTICRIKSIKPNRMLLFGVIGCLLPIVIYISLTDKLLVWFSQTDFILDILILPLILICIIFAWLGFILSVDVMEIAMDTNGMTVHVKPRFPLLDEKISKFKWEDIIAYRLVRDNRGNILRLYLKNGSEFTIAQAFIVDRGTGFDVFQLHFDIYVQLYNIPENPGIF